jgi:hypothetical protein
MIKGDSAMSTKDANGQVTETPQEATQSENSKNSFVVLTVSLVVLALIGVWFMWYFGVLPGTQTRAN